MGLSTHYEYLTDDVFIQVSSNGHHLSLLPSFLFHYAKSGTGIAEKYETYAKCLDMIQYNAEQAIRA